MKDVRLPPDVKMEKVFASTANRILVPLNTFQIAHLIIQIL
jgi:hypothetical protein